MVGWGAGMGGVEIDAHDVTRRPPNRTDLRMPAADIPAMATLTPEDAAGWLAGWAALTEEAKMAFIHRLAVLHSSGYGRGRPLVDLVSRSRDRMNALRGKRLESYLRESGENGIGSSGRS
jgi:hypothetical protein